MTALEEEIVSFDNLLEAFNEVARGKRYKREFQEFYQNLEENLISIQNELIWRTYQPEPTVTFPIREPKLRLITRPHIKDRVVHHALIRVVQPYFERVFHDSSFSCRPGAEYIEAKVFHKGSDRPTPLIYSRNTHARLTYPKNVPYYAAKEYVRKEVSEAYPDAERIEIHLHEGKGQLAACRNYSKILRSAFGRYGGSFVVISIDIRKCFQSIDHDVTKTLINWLMSSDRSRNILEAFIEGMFHGDEFVCWLFGLIIDAVAEGLPIGFLPSQHEANLNGTVIDYLAEVVMGCRGRYVRYMDDVRIICRNRDEAKEILAVIDEFCCNVMRLQLSDKKTTIKTFHKFDTFCGYKVFPHHLEPKEATMKRSHKRLEKKLRQFETGIITAEQLRSSALSLTAYLSHTNTTEDALAQSCLSVAHGACSQARQNA